MTKAQTREGDLFRPEPMIRGETTIGGKDVWYCRRTCRWTNDPEDLFLNDAELMAKYGPACDAEGNRIPIEPPLVISPDILAMNREQLLEKILGEFDEV